MKKKLLAAGLTMAAILTITACGSKTTSEKPSDPTTAVETTVEGDTSAEESTEASDADDAETTAADSKDAGQASDAAALVEAESETAEEATKEEISEFAKKVQDAVSVSDIDALADLCSYPVYLSLKEGEGSEIKNKEEFTAVGADKLFTDALMAEIAAVEPDKLEVFGAGIIMGEENNIIFNKVDGKMAITGINLN